MEMVMHRWFFRDLSEDIKTETHEHLKGTSATAITIGALLIIGGLFAIYSFAVATVASIYFLGSMLFVGGVFYGVSAFSARKWTIALLDVLACALYIVAGVVAFRQPLMTASVVTVVLASMYIFQGIFRSAAAIAVRPPQWGWMLFNGIVTLLFGAVIFAQWPASAIWLLGILVGVDMTLSGWTMVLSGMALRKIGSPATDGPDLKTLSI